MKRCKKISALVLSIAFVVTMTACGSSSAPASKTDPADSTSAGNATQSLGTGTAKAADITVAGVVFQEDQFMKLLSLGYQDAAKAAGVKCLTGNTGNDQAKEVELINTYVAQKISGLAIAPLNSESSVAVLKKADEAGMKIAVTNMDLKESPFIVGGYTSDDYQLGVPSGKAAHDFIKNKLGGKAKIAMLEAASQVPEQNAKRVNGFKDQLKDLEVEYVAEQDAWLQDMAVAKAGDILTAHPEVNIIYAINDGGTIGATMAVKNAGKAGKCFVFGIDIGDQQLAMLKDKDNILQAVTGQDPYTMGFKAMEILIKGLKGEDISASKGKTEIIPARFLSRDDLDGIAKFEVDLQAKLSK